MTQQRRDSKEELGIIIITESERRMSFECKRREGNSKRKLRIVKGDGLEW